MFALAARNGIRLPYESVEALRAAYRFTQLQDFLDMYYRGMSVLVTEQDFFDLAWAYLERAQADRVRHVEMFFDPQGHTVRGVAFATVMNGFTRACRAAGARLGVSASLIMCFLRHLDEADARADPRRGARLSSEIIGVGLDSVRTRASAQQVREGFRRAHATPASTCSPTRARKGRRPMCGRRSTFSESHGWITAIAHWRTRRWSRGSRATAFPSPCARCRT